MSDTPPDRLSVNPKSPHYDEAVLQRDVGIRFNGQEKTNVEEYCISEGWVRVAVGKTLDRKGDPFDQLVSLIDEHLIADELGRCRQDHPGESRNEQKHAPCEQPPPCPPDYPSRLGPSSGVVHLFLLFFRHAFSLSIVARPVNRQTLHPGFTVRHDLIKL